jgi:hypothetical protein
VGLIASQALGCHGDDDIIGLGRTIVLRGQGWRGSTASQAQE